MEDGSFDELAAAAALEVQRVVPIARCLALPASAVAARINLVALAVFDTRTTLYAVATGVDVEQLMNARLPTSDLEHQALNMWAAGDDIGTHYGNGGYRGGGLPAMDLSVTWNEPVPIAAASFTVDASGEYGGGRYRIRLIDGTVEQL